MCIQSIRLTLPCCSSVQEKQTTCALIARIAAMVLGAIALTAGILILGGVLHGVGSTVGGLLTGAGSLMLLAGICLKYVKQSACRKSPQGNPIRQVSQPAKENKITQKPVHADLGYSLDTVIDRVRKSREEGLHTALFVGRTNDQPMPDEKGCAWFSLDLNRETGNSSHHLQIDFNDSKVMQKIHHLFDKVVVDWSVIKFFEGSPWDNLHPLLFKHESSQLIVESDIGIYMSGEDLKFDGRAATMTIPWSDDIKFCHEENEAFNTWKETIGQEKADNESCLFLQNLPKSEIEEQRRLNHGKNDGLELEFKRYILKREGLEPKPVDHRPELLRAICDYLLTLFHHVELKNTSYPYQSEGRPVDYWVARHPK
jgi:hypothetical protein